MVPAVIADPIDKVAELIRQGDTKELSKIFAANVEVTIRDEENVYSKVQAGLILDKFFSQNKPVSVKMLHKVNSNPNYLFGVLILNTTNGLYRIAYTLKKAEGSLMLIELRIETEKVK
jgi:F420-dependent methylenetetrahydromethanopterin dehydrogenase